MKKIFIILLIATASQIQGQNVGIGTTAPNAPLQFGNGSANRKIVLYDVNNNDHQFFGLGLNSGELRYQINEANAGVAHKFFAGLNATTSIELMRIQGDGHVGIGNTDPSHKLDISGRMRIRGGADLFNSAGVYLGGVGAESLVIKSLMGMASDTTVGFYGYSGSGWGFTTDIRNGNTAIGEGTPLDKSGFTVNKKVGAVNAMFGSNTSGIAIESDFPGIGFNTYWNGGRKAIANGYGGYIGINPGGGGMSLAVSSSSSTAGNPITVNTALYIKPDGSIGIGTTAPNGQLQLSNSVQNRKIVLYEPGNNDHEFYGFGINGFKLRYQVPAASDNHVFYSGMNPDESRELFRMTGNGNVGVGVSDPAYRLDVGARMRIRSLPGNSAGLWLNNTANNASPAFIGMQADNQVGFFGSGSGWGLTMNTQNGALGVGGNTGIAGQVLMSNGPVNAPVWSFGESLIQTAEFVYPFFSPSLGNSPFFFNEIAFTITLSQPSRVILFYKGLTYKTCGIGSCSTKWLLETYINGGPRVSSYSVDGASYAGSGSHETSISQGPSIHSLSPGTYTFTFSGTNLFNSPQIFGLTVTRIIIPL